MTNTQHTPTPGPWRVDDETDDDLLHIVGRREGCSRYGVKGEWTLATIDNAIFWVNPKTEAEDRANARLIAEAPAMLDALRVTFQFIEDHALDAFNEVVGETMNAAGNPADRIRAILAKIDGGAE